jgi:AcrR family transcriptional regulator
MNDNNDTYERLEKEERLLRLTEAALDVAARGDYRMITQGEIATEAGVSRGLVRHYLGPIEDLRDFVVQVAITRGILPIIAQALLAKHPDALAAPAEIRRQALAELE